jgi:putative ABC transport system substrate-binding protein
LPQKSAGSAKSAAARSSTRKSELPIAQPTRFELKVNQKVANELDITIPSSVLVRADRVIE